MSNTNTNAIPSIHIQGQPGSGKSGLAYLIKKLLQEKHIQATVLEEPADESEAKINETMDARLKRFEGQTVQIHTQQTGNNHTTGRAFEITSEDVGNVLRNHNRSLPEKEVNEIFKKIIAPEGGRIEKAALHKLDMEEQTTAAYEEISEILIEAGVLVTK